MSKVYEIITAKIIEKLEQGTAPWLKPWNGGEMPRNLITKKPYRGINLFLLNMSDCASPYWLTYNQCREKGGSIRKGERSSQVIYWNFDSKKKTEGDEEEGNERKAPLLRYYCVFNAEQCEGLNIPATETEARHNDPITECERIINDMPNAPKIQHNEPKAYYRPSTDTINMPKFDTFQTAEGYYATALHELCHSTGASHRLNRTGITGHNAFGSSDYGKEELIAEMGASFLCGIAGIEQRTIDNQASYIEGWLKAIREDSKLIISASAQAQRAVDYILDDKEDSPE